MAKTKILIVEDESVIAKDIKMNLQNLGYDVCAVVSSGEEAVKIAEEDMPSLVLMDIILEGGIDGVETAEQIRSRFNIPVVYLTAYADEEIMERAKIAEPYGYILKPFEDRELQSNIEIALYKHEMERKLEESEEWFSTTLRSIGDAVISTDTEGRVRFMNRIAQTLTGWKQEEAEGKPLEDVFNIIDEETDEKINDLFAKVLQDRIMTELADHTVLIAKDGTKRFIDDSGAPIRDDSGNITGIVLTFRDITERKRTEEKIKASLKEKEVLLKKLEKALLNLKNTQSQLIQSEKLASIGQLAAGIAHEINTPIQYVSDNTHFLQESFNDISSLLEKYNLLLNAAREKPVFPELVSEVENALDETDIEFLSKEIPIAIKQSLEGIEHVADIVRAMKEFAHPVMEKKIPIDINKAIENTIIVTRNKWKYVAEMETNLDQDLPLVPCLPTEFNEVVLNIIVNAADAIADVVGDRSEDKGTIAISTRSDDDWVEIRISDTGAGVPEEIQSRIFDPFFTTKDVGEGTGQGLAIAHNVVVERHKGSLTFETEMGKGTTFIIRLPIGD